MADVSEQPLYMVRLANGGVEVYERRTLNYVGQWPLSEQYIADAVCDRLNHRLAQARAEGYRAGVEAAIKAATDYKATWPENKPELWAIRGAIEYTIEEIRALAETGGKADSKSTRQSCAHFNQQGGQCAYGEDYPACADKCCVRKE